MAANYFGTDGIRLHAEDFTTDFLAAVIRGLTAYHGSADFSLLIAGDTRESTARIMQDLINLAAASGISVATAGIFPTPAINFYTKSAGFDFAIDITASHNPATYNGLKIFENQNGESIKLTAPGRAAIEAELTHITPAPTLSAAVASDHRAAAIAAYLDHLRDYLGACDFRGLKLAMDCANGATSAIAATLFSEFGATVTLINADQNYGTAINYNCGSTNLEALTQTVVSGKLDFDVAFDGDGDRCLLVDGAGTVVDGDKILAILAEYLELKSFVATVMAGQGIFAWSAERGINVEVSDVGDQNVFALMQEKGIKLGGEQSGHIILPYEPMGDGYLTALMITKILSERRTTLAELANSIPVFPQLTENIPATAAQKANLSAAPAATIIKKYSDFLASKQGRVLVRPSGTEDLIRLTMWGTKDLNLPGLIAELAKELQEVL